MISTLILTLTLTTTPVSIKFWSDDGSLIPSTNVHGGKWVVSSIPRYVGIITPEDCGVVKLRVKLPNGGWRAASVECGRGQRVVDLRVRGNGFGARIRGDRIVDDRSDGKGFIDSVKKIP